MFLVWAVAMLALPVTAAAKPGYFVSPSFRYAEAKFRGTHGYQVTISAGSDGVTVAAHKGLASVSYDDFKGKLKGNSIGIRLPRIGRVFVHFHELKRSHMPPAKNCRGPATLIRHGVFEGLVVIKGERGFTKVRRRRMRAKIVREPSITCRRRLTAHASAAADEFLFAMSERRRRYLIFTADKWPPSQGFSPLFFGTTLFRWRGSMAIVNSNSAFTEDSTALDVAKPPRSATVDPPGPFTGTATFEEKSKDEFRWAGDLAVELPGIGEVSLAGPKFKSELCIGRRCKGDTEEAEVAARVFAQGSGSHSQPLALARLSSLR